jgi:acetyl esterase/lipase
MTLLASQPFKGVYVLGAIGFEVLRFPLFLFKYLVGYGRQHPQWTYRQAVAVRVFYSALYHIASIRMKTALPHAPGAEKERFVLIKPAKDEVYKGPLRGVSDIKPVEIGATWYPAPLSAGSDKSNIRVILHIHGGAFVTGDGRTLASGYMANKFLKHSSATHVFCPQYRLSELPASKTSNPFPAALQDTLTSYLYLLNDLGIPPKDIILAGDSAGGNLAISLLRYIAEYGSDLDIPNPSTALLWSPWVDPSDTTGSYVYDNDHYVTDYLSPPFTSWGTAAYAGLAGLETLKQPYVSHKYKMFKTEVPMFVNTGGGEVLYYDDVEWAGKMKEAGNDVTLDVEDLVPHDVLLMGNILGFNTEATNCAKRAGEWLKEKRR